MGANETSVPLALTVSQNAAFKLCIKAFRPVGTHRAPHASSSSGGAQKEASGEQRLSGCDKVSIVGGAN